MSAQNTKHSLDKHIVYTKAYIKALRKLADEGTPIKSNTAMKVLFYGVKTLITQPKSRTKDEVETEFKEFIFLKNIAALLTPNEFVQLFPITKEYDGDRYEIKDYFYTKDYIERMDKNRPIGDKALNFLIEYTNQDINIFNARSVITMSDLRKYDGHLDVLEEFAASQGETTPNTFKDSKGNAMYVRYGKVERINTTQSNVLKLVR